MLFVDVLCCLSQFTKTNVIVERLKFIGIMATCELRGALKYRDGQTKAFTVKTEKNLTSMIIGIKKLNADISGVLTDLVLKERGNNKGDIQVDGKTGTYYLQLVLTLADG